MKCVALTPMGVPKKLMQQYGDALFCVRYRYDASRCKQMKTAEIIISESDWTPPAPPKYLAGDLVPLRIGIKEVALQEQARAVGGEWDRLQQAWLVRYGCIAGTELEKFIIIETKKSGTRKKSL